MLNRRPPIRYRRTQYSASPPNVVGLAEADIIKEVEKIPLPNETENLEGLNNESDLNRGFPPIDFFGRNIDLDIIILIGLIFLLIQERIEDEFLLILLVYILLF